MLTASPALATGSAARPPKTFTREELAARADALALRVGTKVTTSAVLLAAVVVILIGAQALLGAMESMNRDVNEMNRQLAISNKGLAILNETMDSVPPTSEHMNAIVKTVAGTKRQVTVSATRIGKLRAQTEKINGQIGSITSSTTKMRTSLQSAGSDTTTLSKTITSLNQDIGPLVKTQHQLLTGTKNMRSGMDGMNASLAYVVRVLNYIAEPPTGGGMTIRADLPKQTLPPLPGIKAEVDPVNVFPRDVWPVYTGP